MSFPDHFGPASSRDCVTFSYVRAVLRHKQETNAAAVSTGHVLACRGAHGPQILVSPLGNADG
jgi:hypothetical protein